MWGWVFFSARLVANALGRVKSCGLERDAIVICQFCAEEIQDSAILCRFCRAERSSDGHWALSGGLTSAPVRRKGGTTIRITGGLFCLSGVLSLTSITAAVPLLGAMRGGVVALGYNGLFGLLFLGMGVGLWMAQGWGYRLFLVGTAVYSLDRLLFLMSPGTREAYLAAKGVTPELGTLVDPAMLSQTIVLTGAVSLLCWWGFAGFVYLRRDYFGGAAEKE